MQEQEPDTYSKLLMAYSQNYKWIGDLDKLLKEIENMMKMIEGKAE